MEIFAFVTGSGKHDEELLLEAQVANPGCGVVAAGSRKDLPGDSEGGALVFQLPNMGGKPGALLVPVPAIALVLVNPVPRGALCEACVGDQALGSGHCLPPQWPLHPPLGCSFPFLTLLLCWLRFWHMLGMVE